MTVTVHPQGLTPTKSKSKPIRAVNGGGGGGDGGLQRAHSQGHVRVQVGHLHASGTSSTKRGGRRISTILVLLCVMVLLGIIGLLTRAATWRIQTVLLHAWRRCLHWYLRRLHVQPLGTRALTAGAIFFLADLAAQRLSSVISGTSSGRLGGGGGISVGRLMRYTSYGGLIMGPFLYYWYALMNAYAPRDDMAAALAKCCFEQLTLEPFCIVMYILYDGIVCRRGWRPVVRRCRTAFFPLWFKNAVFWLPANFCNYYIATPDLRVVFSNLCSLFWNAYFSSKVNIAPPNSSSPSKPHNSKQHQYHLLPNAAEAQV